MKLHPGDIVEIRTPAGLSYVQVTHNHASYPEVVRALPGLHRERPADTAALVRAESLFTAMVALGGAIAKDRIDGEVIGNAKIPAQYEAFPTFRMPIRDRAGNVAYWWLWDGQGLRYETELGPAAERYPMREVMPVDVFVTKLAERSTQG